MADRLVIERLELDGFCGVTADERSVPQAMALDVELVFDMLPAATADNLDKTVDYVRLIDLISAITQKERFALIETLAERVAQSILSDHAVAEVTVWARKLRPQVKGVSGSVGAKVSRRRIAAHIDQPDVPAAWLIEHRGLLKAGRALDLACGKGRNALYLAKEGFRVEAWDRDAESLKALQVTASSANLMSITTRLVDLEKAPQIPSAAFDLIAVFYYLQRDLIPHIIQGLAPGGIVVYETFLIDNHQRFDHPRRREFCLQHNELLSLFRGLRTLAYREGALDPERGPYLASLVAQQAL
jgi:FolB domain-containing protein